MIHGRANPARAQSDSPAILAHMQKHSMTAAKVALGVPGSPKADSQPPAEGDAAADLEVPDEAPMDGEAGPYQEYVVQGGYGISETVESCIVVLTAIAMGAVLFVLGDVLVPLILAVFVSSMLVPLLDLLTDRPLRLCGKYWCDRWWCGPVLDLEKTCLDKPTCKKWPDALGGPCATITSVITLRLPNVLALVCVLGALCVGLAASGLVLYRSIEPFVEHAPEYERRVEEIGEWLYRGLNDGGNLTLQDYTRSQLQADQNGVPAGTSQVMDIVTDGTFQTLALSALEAIAAAAGTAALIMMYVIFILLGRQARGERKSRKVTYAVEHQLKVYVSWKFIISVTTGILIGGTLKLLHCDLAALFGFMVFGLNFIPTVGLLAAVMLPLPLLILAPTCRGSLPGSDPCWNDGAEDPLHPWMAAGQSNARMEEYAVGDTCRMNSYCGDLNADHSGGVDYGMEPAEKIFGFIVPYMIQLVVANFVEPMVRPLHSLELSASASVSVSVSELCGDDAGLRETAEPSPGRCAVRPCVLVHDVGATRGVPLGAYHVRPQDPLPQHG